MYLNCAITIGKALGEEATRLPLPSPGFSSAWIILPTACRQRRSPLRRVMIVEWMAPVYHCGHWILYQVAYAGGVDMLSNPAGDSIVTPWEKYCVMIPKCW